MALRSLRADIESDLGDTLEGEFAQTITLVSPDGITYTVQGRVQYESVEVNEQGQAYISKVPVVVLRRTSLARIPVAGENWLLPQLPDPTGAPLGDFVLNISRAPKDNQSIGYIKLYPMKAGQS